MPDAPDASAGRGAWGQHVGPGVPRAILFVPDAGSPRSAVDASKALGDELRRCWGGAAPRVVLCPGLFEGPDGTELHVAPDRRGLKAQKQVLEVKKDLLTSIAQVARRVVASGAGVVVGHG